LRKHYTAVSDDPNLVLKDKRPHGVMHRNVIRRARNCAGRKSGSAAGLRNLHILYRGADTGWRAKLKRVVVGHRGIFQLGDGAIHGVVAVNQLHKFGQRSNVIGRRYARRHLDGSGLDNGSTGREFILVSKDVVTAQNIDPMNVGNECAERPGGLWGRRGADRTAWADWTRHARLRVLKSPRETNLHDIDRNPVDGCGQHVTCAHQMGVKLVAYL
jgi:hypothetical protein